MSVTSRACRACRRGCHATMKLLSWNLDYTGQALHRKAAKPIVGKLLQQTRTKRPTTRQTTAVSHLMCDHNLKTDSPQSLDETVIDRVTAETCTSTASRSFCRRMSIDATPSIDDTCELPLTAGAGGFSPPAIHSGRPRKSTFRRPLDLCVVMVEVIRQRRKTNRTDQKFVTIRLSSVRQVHCGVA